MVYQKAITDSRGKNDKDVLHLVKFLLHLVDHLRQPLKFRTYLLIIESMQFFNIGLYFTHYRGIKIFLVASLVLEAELERLQTRLQDLHAILRLQKTEEGETHREFHIVASDCVWEVAQHLAQFGQTLVRQMIDVAIWLSLLLHCFTLHGTHRLKTSQRRIELIMVQRHQPTQCLIVRLLYLISMHWT